MSDSILSFVPAMIAAAAEPAAAPQGLPSFFDLVVAGGPVMWPIGACSVVALAYAFERSLRLRPRALGNQRFADDLVRAVDTGGPAQALELCARETTPLARIMTTALRHAASASQERERRVEEVATSEVRRLSGNLKPLLIVYVVAPLLGLLGTVWGLILCFATIAGEKALGRPDLLATGVYQALITTAAGLAIAIPTVVVYYWLKARVERFSRRTEELYSQVDERLVVAEVARANP